MLSSTNYHQNRPYEISNLTRVIIFPGRFYSPVAFRLLTLQNILTDKHTCATLELNLQQFRATCCRQNDLRPTGLSDFSWSSRLPWLLSQLHAKLPEAPRRSDLRLFWSFWSDDDPVFRGMQNDLVSLWDEYFWRRKSRKRRGKRIGRRTIEASTATCLWNSGEELYVEDKQSQNT